MNVRPALVCLALASTVVSGCGASSATHASHIGRAPVTRSATVMLDWYPNSDHGGLYTAIRRGYFARNGIVPSAKVPTGSTSAIQLVAAGHADFGISYETDLLAARAQHIPVRSVMCIMQHPLNTVMTLKS